MIATLCASYRDEMMYINWKVHAACNLNFIVKDGLFKVTDSHVYTGKVNVVIYRKRCCNNRLKVILKYGLSNSSNCDDLECP